VLASCAHSGGPSRTKPFTGIPNLRLSYYEVSGSSAEEIRRSINAHRPRDSHDGQRVDALTEWTIGWSIEVREPGGCDLSNAQVRYAATVTLPRHADPATLPEPLRSHWEAFVASLARHEDWHARYAYEHLGDVRAALRGSRCDTAEAVASAAVHAIAEVERNYDLDARHRGGEVVPFP
jgi:predicted secreted Zn-dependent protease